MKKLKFVAIAALIIAMTACITLGTLAFADEADITTPPNTTETSNKISTSSIDAWKFGGGWSISTSYNTNGVLASIPGEDAEGVGVGNAWNRQLKIPNDDSMNDAFSLKNNDKVTIEFSAKMFDESGNLISKSAATNPVEAEVLDVYVLNADNNTQLGMVRIWFSAGGATNGDHPYDLFGNDWNNSPANSAGHWMKGDATESSSFFLQVDKQNFISSYVGGSITPLGTSEYIENRVEAIDDVENIYFRIQGNNGFITTTEITIKSINGQSLANADGYFTDTVAPVFKPATVSATISLDEEFTISTEAYDLLGDVEYFVKVGEGEFVEGKKFTPDTEGELTVTLKAVDAAGNSSTKDYTFQVTNDIEAPVITTMPTIENQQAVLFSTLTFDKPVFTDSTNSATTLLKMFKGDDEEPFATLTENSHGQFAYVISPTFQTGEYTLVYEITNKGGTTKSAPVTVTLTAETINKVNFVNGETANMVADYVEQGIRLRSSDNFKRFYFGEFDISEGIDVKFIVNETSASGIRNNAEYFNLILTNVDNPVYQIMYRVWIGYSGPDKATNVYIYDTEHPNSPFDITDTGWISRVVDDVDNKYHMAFDMEETFQGERTAGMQRIDNAYAQLVEFLEACPSTNFRMSFEVSRLGASTDYYEAIITELNGQSLANPITWKNAKLSVQSIVPEMIEKDATLTIKAYAKDLTQNAALKLTVSSPDGQSQTFDFEGRTIDYTFAQLGNYKLTVSTVGANGEEVRREFDVVCKSAIQEITIELADTYAESYSVGQSVDIISATYSDNVATNRIVVKTPAGTETEVTAGSSYTFVKPGIYTITYIAMDASEPTPNEKKVTATINVPDTTKPIVEVIVKTDCKVGDKITPQINVTDDSAYDVTVTLEKPDKSSQKLSGKYEVTLDAAGTYTLKVAVEDAYGNRETVTKTITVTEAGTSVDEGKPKDTKLGLIIGLCVGGVVLLGGAAAVAIILIKKKKAVK